MWKIVDGACDSSVQNEPVNVVVLQHFKESTNEKSKDVTTLDWNGMEHYWQVVLMMAKQEYGVEMSLNSKLEEKAITKPHKADAHVETLVNSGAIHAEKDPIRDGCPHEADVHAETSVNSGAIHAEKDPIRDGCANGHHTPRFVEKWDSGASGTPPHEADVHAKTLVNCGAIHAEKDPIRDGCPHKVDVHVETSVNSGAIHVEKDPYVMDAQVGFFTLKSKHI
ncbi:hypothetical protein JHK87_047651 [Glycine soja]|nr:hypothetical protein JHK87_047651 [Glycine soja]